MTSRLSMLVILASSWLWGSIAFSDTSCQLLLRSKSPNYLQSTLNSLEAMRGDNGLLVDTIWIRQSPGRESTIQVLNPYTSPTNIAVDLLIQAELAQDPRTRSANIRKISRVLSTLAQVEFHPSSGLFFSRYFTDKSSSVKDFDVSSIDNLHLALALWTIKENFADTSVGLAAQKLFERMDFSIYLEERSGLLKGNLKFKDGEWITEEYTFSNLGSESRGLYSAGWALGLFRKKLMTGAHVKSGLLSSRAEVFHSQEGPILKLWDGAAFQLFFPKIFIGEENYSPLLAGIFKNAGQFMLAEGARRNLLVPAAHSAARAAIREDGHGPTYQDKAGIKALVSSDNQDLMDPSLEGNWDAVFTPYALFMAATSDPSLLWHLSKAEKIISRNSPFYSTRMGWMDGLHVGGPNSGRVVPAQLSLNQGMIALSLLQIQSSDGMSLSARTLYRNRFVNSRLKFFYQQFDERLKSAAQQIY